MRYGKLLFILSLLVYTACESQQAPVARNGGAEDLPRSLQAEIELGAPTVHDSFIRQRPDNAYPTPLFYDRPIMLYIGDEDFKLRDSLQ